MRTAGLSHTSAIAFAALLVATSVTALPAIAHAQRATSLNGTQRVRARVASPIRRLVQRTRGGSQRLRAAVRRGAASTTSGAWSEPAHGEWSRDVAGRRADPVNIYLHAESLAEVRTAFVRAGWSEATPNNARDNVRYLRSVAVRGLEVARSRITGHPIRDEVIEQTIQSMPVSPQSYHGHLEVLAFEKDNHVLAGRHHFRVYDTHRRDGSGRSVWAVSASRDIGLEFDVHRPQQGFLNHRTEPNADLERDAVVGALRSVGGVQSTHSVALNYGTASASGLHSQDGHALDVVVARGVVTASR